MRNLALLTLLALGAATEAFTPAKLSSSRRRAATLASSPSLVVRPSSPSASSQQVDVETGESLVNSAAARYSGAGAAAVNMNAYNVPLDRSIEEWVANLTPASSFMEEGVYLGAKSSKELFVDTLTFEVNRAGGLGLELLEIAGGREDGLGITLVEGVVEGGNSDGCGIIPGDSVSKLTVRRKSASGGGGAGLAEVNEETAVSTECLGFDATVEAIFDLPQIETDDETILVTVKRLRRKPKVTMTLKFPPEQDEPDATIELFAGENLRRAMLTRGVKLNDALSRRFDSGGVGDCGADGTCATCVVGVSNGMDLLNPINEQEKQILAKNPRWRMACKTIVGFGMKEGEMTLQVNPRQWDQ